MSNIPTIGRIVHYRPPTLAGKSGPQPIVAAIITHVYQEVPENTVDLTTYPRNRPPGFAEAANRWYGDHQEDLPDFMWMWPPRVGLKPG